MKEILNSFEHTLLMQEQAILGLTIGKQWLFHTPVLLPIQFLPPLPSGIQNAS